MASFKALGLGVVSILSLCVISLGAWANPTLPLEQLYENSQGSPAISFINSTKVSLDLEIYTMKDLAVIAALKAAMKRGVKLRIVQTLTPIDVCKVFDPITSTDDEICVQLKQFVPYVKANGGQYTSFGSNMCATPGANCFEHGKVMISDSKKVLMSTGNFDASNLCDLAQNPNNCNRDFTVISVDPSVISVMQKIYDKDFLGVAYDLESIANAPEASRLTISPYSLPPLLAFIQSAKKSIQVEAQYLKNEDLRNALKDAAKRGVKVFVMVASTCAFGKPDPTHDAGAIAQWTQIYTEFDQAGIHSKMFNGSILIKGKPGYMHAKAILVDGARAWVGSANGSTTSLTQNREYGIFTSEAQVVKLLSSVLYSDFMNPNAENWKESLACKKDPKLNGITSTYRK